VRKKRRKTIYITELIDEVNRVCRESHTTFNTDCRKGVCMLLEGVLTDANVYAGFGYLRQEDVPAGEKPGIIRGNDADIPNQYPDEWRRVYYYHRFLTTK
jgi:hypothetical protein